jgi:hypothetical protein
MHPMRTKDEEAQHDAAHQMIQIANPWTIRRWSESKLANGKSRVLIAKDDAHRIHSECTEETQVHQKTLAERCSSQGASGPWRVD